VPLDPSVMESAIRRLLDGHPDALVTAIADEGLFTEMPDSLTFGEHRVVQARSALDLVAPASRPAVIEAWEKVRREGAASTSIQLAGADGATTPGTVFLFDVRALHGVYIGVLAAADGQGEALEEVAEIAGPPPRLCRTRKDELALLREIDPLVTAVLGWEPEDMLGKRTLDFIHPDDGDRIIDAWMEMLARPGMTLSVRARHRHKDGRWVWMQISNRNLLDDPDCGYVDCEMLDVSEEVEAQEAVRASEQLLRRLAEALPVGVVHVDVDRRVLYANGCFSEILGVDPEHVGGALHGCVTDVHRLDSALHAVLSGADVDVELEVERADGSGRRLCTLSLRALTTNEGTVTGAVGSLADVTEATRLRNELEQRATTDALTGCVNRATALAGLSTALEGTDRRATDGVATGTSAIFVDLDGFKAVNDRYGHVVGDHLLVAVADRLRDVVRADDLVGRLGGDEFLVVCPAMASPEDALALAERLAAAVAEPLPVDGELLSVRASIGLAFADGPIDAKDLIARADAAMYRSKRTGRGRPVLASGEPSAGPVGVDVPPVGTATA
jgi:diguanylate cyclase (GGDEF)-like protein/PAS domain S-box-containing protein